ncbi:MAG: helix-turn-helix transcriptional regulator [Candidatus Binataceae bacterium]
MKKKTFGEFLAQARAQSTFSQKDLAARLRKADGTPISAQYLNDIERDRRAPPSNELIQQIASLLGVAEDVLFHHAGRLSPDLAGASADQEELKAAYVVFRRALKIPKSRSQN